MLITEGMLLLPGQAGPPGSPGEFRAAAAARAAGRPHQVEVAASPLFQDGFLRLAAALWEGTSELLAPSNRETKTRLS